MFDAKRALALMENLQLSAEALKHMPTMIPIAKEIFDPVFNNTEQRETVNTTPITRRRIRAPMSDARRKRLSIAAKKRWRVAKKAGRSTIGGSV